MWGKYCFHIIFFENLYCLLCSFFQSHCIYLFFTLHDVWSIYTIFFSLDFFHFLLKQFLKHVSRTKLKLLQHLPSFTLRTFRNLGPGLLRCHQNAKVASSLCSTSRPDLPLVPCHLPLGVSYGSTGLWEALQAVALCSSSGMKCGVGPDPSTWRPWWAWWK